MIGGGSLMAGGIDEEEEFGVAADPEMLSLSPAERIGHLGISPLPPPLLGCLSRVDPDSSSTVTVTIKVAAVAATVNRDASHQQQQQKRSGQRAGGGGWDVERAVGLQVLSQLMLASRKDLGRVTVVSVHSSGGLSPTSLHATRALLREVLGPRGAAVGNGHSLAELRAFFQQVRPLASGSQSKKNKGA